jgi:uncharacterized membrane protein YadS
VLPLGPATTDLIATVSKILLVIALGMIGLDIDRQTLRQLSLRSIAFGIGLWLLVAPAALLLVTYR